MNYSPKSSLRIRCVFCIFMLLLLSVADKGICAQEIHPSDTQKKLEITKKSNSSIYEGLSQFFFYVQESYFAGHLMYCGNIENVICYGKSISPYFYHWVLENEKRLNIECDGYSVVIFLDKDTIISLHKDVDNLRASVNTELGLWRLINLYDKNDVVIEDTSIYTKYYNLRQSVIVELHECHGYEMEMQTAAESEKPVMLILIFDHGELNLHPLSNTPQHHISSEYLHQLEQLASSVCQKYNASKMLFTAPMLYRE